MGPASAGGGRGAEAQPVRRPPLPPPPGFSAPPPAAGSRPPSCTLAAAASPPAAQAVSCLLQPQLLLAGSQEGQAAAAQGESGGAPALPNQAQGEPQGAPVGPDQAQAVQGIEGVGPGPAVRGVGRLALEPGTKAYVRTLLPRNMFKYWLQRYSLFSKLDQGVQMDTEGWWSVTPEVLAQHQAGQCRAHSAGQVALDAMAGCAGNVIALAQLYPLVYAVEISAKRAAMAQHNAGVYGVGHKLQVLCADFFAAAPTLVADTIFVSPPWGGPSYKWCDAFQVLQPAEGMSFSIQHLLQVALGGVPGSPSRGVVALFLPRTTLLAELAALVPAGQVWQVERNYVNCRLKGITFYCYT
ncbi:RNA cap guanine-N2 methyltransferase-domain-containing protein [Haematococcus lacustris]